MKKILIVLLITLVFVSLAFGERNIDAKRSLNKSTEISDLLMNVNRMSCWFRNNSVFAYNYMNADWGGEWPRGSGLSPLFAAGMWVGAKYGDEVRVAATQHDASEFQAGQVISSQVAANRLDPAYRWYVIEPGGGADYLIWPFDQGAPADEDGNPLVLGDRTAFSVFNDLGPHDEFSSNKLSVEIQQTVFAYNRADALGDMNFMKWRIVNRSDTDWDSTYLSIWVDPDIGYGYDDLVGCDSTLGLGYCYNGSNVDQNYGSAPPAAGYDFFQGPILDAPGETVTMPDGTVLTDKTMMKMTAFIFYNNNSSAQGNPFNSNDVWNYFRGIWKDGDPITADGVDGTDQSFPPVTFMFSGDPEGATGWRDPTEDDKRFLMTTGPFVMPQWVDANGNGLADFGETGVQDIVAGQMATRGNSYTNSVTELKVVDDLAQLAYDLNFVLARAPAPPVVEVTETENAILLTWGTESEFNLDGVTPYFSQDPIVEQAMGDTVIMDNVVKVIDDDTYNFIGYTVYQYSTAAGDDPIQLRSWAMPTGADPDPYDGQHFLEITTNTSTAVGNVGDPLFNGKTYYFGVKATGYLEYGGPPLFDSPHAIVTVVPHFTPGERYNAAYGDTLTITKFMYDQTLPESQGSAVVLAIDKKALTGDDYMVSFNADGTWNLTSGADTLLADQANQTGDDTYAITDGFQLKVLGPAPGILSVTQVDPDDWSVELDNNLNNSLGYQFDPTVDVRYIAAAQGGGAAATNLGRWDWRGHMTPDDYLVEICDEADGNFVISGWADAVDPATGTWLFKGWLESDTLGGAQTQMGTTGRLPFRVWRVEPDGTTTEVLFAISDDDDNWLFNQTQDTPYTYGSGFERFYATDYPYDEADILSDGGDNALNNIFWGSIWDSGHTLGRFIWGIYSYGADNAAGYSGILGGKLPPVGTVARFNTAKPHNPNDYYTFTTPAATITEEDLTVDVKNINVVPNPYYGYHSGERNPFDRWVQFTNLPETCTIRIFDLSGTLVQIIEKDDESTFAEWNLTNEYLIPVASGIYVYHVETANGDKVGKMVVFMANERIDTF